MDTLANGGVGIVIGDGTNRMAYYVGGSNQSGFRHKEGPIEWTCFILDTTSLPTNKTTLAGSEASMTWTSITQIGPHFTTLAKALGNVENCFVDVIRFGAEGLRVTGGGTGTEGQFSEIATADRSTADGAAYGVCRELAEGVYGLQTALTLGDNTSLAVDFDSDGESVVFEPPPAGVAVDRFWLKIEGNSTGTCSVVWTGCNFICPAGTGAELIATDADVDTLTIESCLFKGFEQGVSFITATTANTHSVTDNTFDGCGEIDLGFLLQDGTWTGNTISNSTNSANGALTLSSTGYTSGVDLTDTTFVSGGTGHAIYITNQGTYDFTDLVFSGYGAADTTNAAVYNNSGGAVTINAQGCTGLTVRNGTGASTTVNQSVSLVVSVKESDGTDIQDARVLLEAQTGGSAPADDVVTITRVSGTASVAHTAHGMVNGDRVVIRGALQHEYNGVKTISNVTTNAYDYTVTGTPTTPATGTITATQAYIDELTSALGVADDSMNYGGAAQPVRGTARKGSAVDSPKFAPGSIVGDIDDGGFTTTVIMISDE
jgi:hypothetical protein